MSFFLRIQFIAVAQVVITALITYYLVTQEHRDLSAQSVASLESFLIAQKQQELKNYTDLALAAVKHIYVEADSNDADAKQRVAEIINALIYNENDGYFFVYDELGTNIVHPIEPERVGNNYWDLTNHHGEPTIQILINNAKQGGGFYRYPWNQPSTSTTTEKLSYSDFMPKWGWMLGTGVYLDNVERQLTSIKGDIENQIDNTRFIILLVALSSIFLIFTLGSMLHLTQKKQTDAKLNHLGQKLITLQEEEQRHISRELHDGIVQVLVSIKYSLEATSKHLAKLKVEKPLPLTNAEANLGRADKRNSSHFAPFASAHSR